MLRIASLVAVHCAIPRRQIRNPSLAPGLMALQERLLADGYLRGAVDGLLGPVTRSALSAWQHDAGLIDDGFPDAHSLQRLGIHAPD